MTDRKAPDRLTDRFLRGLNVSVQGNSQAFGYSITITATYGAVSAARGTPTAGELLGFAVFGVAAFSLLNVLVRQMMPEEPSSEQRRVLLVATATDFLAVAAAVGSAIGLSVLIPGWAVWLVAPLLSSLVYVFIQSIELAVGRARSDDPDSA